MLLRYENYILPLTSIAVVAEAHKRGQHKTDNTLPTYLETEGTTARLQMRC